MILCFHCSQEIKTRLDELLRVGGYKDYGEVLSSAVSNLAILQKEIGDKGAIVIGDTSTPHVTEVTEQPERPRALVNRARRTASPPAAEVGLPELLRRPTGPTPAGARLPDDRWATGDVVPLDRWIFGQYNKLLPAKVSCRGLATLLVQEAKGVPLERAAMDIALAARSLGSALREYDRRFGPDRDTALATAFPNEDEDGKSVTRYATQFVAGINKAGQVSGLLIDLKLINYTNTKDVRLQLTDAGWRLALLESPVLDGTLDHAVARFTTEELNLLLLHIQSRVPVEDFAFRTIMEAISKGACTPEQLDTAMRAFVSPERRDKLKPAFLSSQRSGAISRMSDVGLVARVRDGVKVSYALTRQAEHYLETGRIAEGALAQ